jgi:hypothetical protein
MWVKMLLAAALVSGSAFSASGQRNADVPKGPAVWPLIKSTPQGNSEPPPKAAPGAKNTKDIPAGDTTGATGKGTTSRPK